jgi:hypothetical protein
VRVVLDRVDAVEKRLQFSILDEEGDRRREPGAGAKAMGKQALREEKRAKAARKDAASQAVKAAKRGKYRAPKASQLRKKKRR